MVKSRVIYLFLCLTLVFTLVSAFVAPVMAQSTTPTPTATPPPVTLTLKASVPSYSDDSGSTFTYDVTLEYTGLDRITVNLTNSVPPGWNTYIQYLGKQVNSIDLGPAQYGSATGSFTLYLAPNSGSTPEPGDYTVTLKGTSGNFNPTLDLKATVRTKYAFVFTADTGRLSMSATAGALNHYTLDVTNNSSVALQNINFNSTKPEDWTVTFTPAKIDTLGVSQTVQVDAVVTPPSGKTVAGDYMVTMRANNDKVNGSIDVRVTALTPSIWGWVGIIIVVVVIAGIVVLFLRLGRR